MSDLDRILRRLGEHEGVEQVLLVGRDGLLVRRAPGDDAFDAEAAAALSTGVVTACDAFGASAEQFGFTTAVLEFESGVAIVVSLSDELLLTLVLRPDVGFAPLLREARRIRPSLAGLL